MRHIFTLMLGLSLVGCGAGFDPPSEVKSLRVLGVQKDKPYPQPGDTVNLQMLWHDGLANPLDPQSTEREVQVTWITGCTNPASEDFYGCFSDLSGSGVMTSNENPASFQISPEILNELPPPRPDQPLLGRSFAFFTLCAGTIDFEVPSEEGALPIVCRDAAGNRMGPDSFVVGYTSLFTYAAPNLDGLPIENHNPTITGFRVGGKDLENFCIDGNCLRFQPYEEPEIDCTSEEDAHLCFETCKDDGDSSCPEIGIQPVVDPASAETDDAAKTFFGHDFTEQMWINYYVDRGSVKGDGVRLLNDATTGWNDDSGTDFYAPKDPGPVTIWAVVHDDRGGQSWIRTRIMIVARSE